MSECVSKICVKNTHTLSEWKSSRLHNMVNCVNLIIVFLSSTPRASMHQGVILMRVFLSSTPRALMHQEQCTY
jgi:hypothetical protein